MKNKTEVIVVGGGPAGIAAAVTIARAGREVLLIERGNFSGSKNVFGGAIYAKPTREIFPDFEASAPLERKVVEHRYIMCTQDESVSASYLAREHEITSYTVLRPKFDRWMAQEAQKAGVVLVTETLVKEIISKENKVIGIKTELEDYYADIVIIADGVNSLLARQLGLRKDFATKDVALSVKEVIKLNKDTIENRFNLREGEGAVYEVFGAPMAGILGLGYLYTNKDTVSIGLGVSLEELAKRKLKPYELLDKMREHPAFSTFLKDGELVEYSAHLIPEGGYKRIPKLYSDGVMVIGDSAMLVNNIHWEGTNLAMTSGKFAGETALEALSKNDFSANTLCLYQKKLENSFVIKDLKTYKNFMDIFHDRCESFFAYYPKKMTEFFAMFTTVDGIPKAQKHRGFLKSIFTDRSMSELFKDAIAFVKLGLGALK